MSVNSGNNNIAVGAGTLGSNTTGANNVSVGATSGNNITTGSNNIVIGSGATASSATVSNEIVLGTSTQTLKIQGGLNYNRGANITGTSSLTAPFAQFYLIEDSGSPYTITLPSPSAQLNGCVVHFRRYLTATNTITFHTITGTHIVQFSSATASASASLLSSQYSTTFICGLNDWFQMQTI